MSTKLELTDAQNLQSVLKQLLIHLKKFSVDAETLDKCALQEMKKKQAAKEKKRSEKRMADRERMKSTFRVTESEIDDWLEESFQLIDEAFEVKDDEEFINILTRYNMFDYIKDMAPELYKELEDSCNKLKNEIKSKLLQLT